VAFDQNRFDQLIDKRGREGLSDEEANELGRLFAEKEGKPYANAQSRRMGEPVADEQEAAGKEGEAPPEAEERGPASDTTA
jgi:hypothetical protein